MRRATRRGVARTTRRLGGAPPTAPFVTLGVDWGAEGVLLGRMAGGIAFGLGAVVVVQRLIAKFGVLLTLLWSRGNEARRSRVMPAAHSRAPAARGGGARSGG